MAYLRLGHIKPRSGDIAGGLRDCLDYIFNPKKTEEKSLVSGYNILPKKSCETESAFSDMIAVKDSFGKPDGRQGYHYKLSFPADDPITPELAMQITHEFCEMCFSDYQCAYAVHTNTAHMHSHIVFNSVSMYDGRKYHYKKGDWAKIIQPAANKICEKYGLSGLDLDLDEELRLTHKCRKYLVHRKSTNDDFYSNCMIRADIDECIRRAADFPEFVFLMQQKGHVVKTSGAHMTVLAPGRKRPCRTYILTPDKQTYTKENIERMIDGTYLDKNAILDRLFSDWNQYLKDKVVILKKIKLPVSVAQDMENREFRIKNGIHTLSDIQYYRYYLNQADKQLNILRNHIRKSLDAKKEYTDALAGLFACMDDYQRYLETKDERYREGYGKAVRLYDTVSRYGLVELYEFQKEGNALLNAIDAYKKHVFVEGKIATRIEKELEQKQKAADRNGKSR